MSDLDVRTAVLETKMESLKSDVSEIKTDVAAIRDTLSQARGGWKTLVMVAGAAGAVGALLGKLVPFLPVR